MTVRAVGEVLARFADRCGRGRTNDALYSQEHGD